VVKSLEMMRRKKMEKDKNKWERHVCVSSVNEHLITPLLHEMKSGAKRKYIDKEIETRKK
jgi:hypothetical protein